MMETTDFSLVRLENGPALTLAGFQERYTFDNMRKIPAQWNRFGPRIEEIPAKADPVTYGVVVGGPGDTDFQYWSVVPVSDTAALPEDFAILSVPAQQYAVFPHNGTATDLCATIDAAFKKWLPDSPFEHAGTLDFLERYGEKFDPATGTGDMEIWMPVKERTGK